MLKAHRRTAAWRSSGSSPEPGPQLGHLSPQHLKLLPQHQRLGVLGLDHLPQPGIGHAQGSDLIEGRRHIGHKPSMIIVGET
jgi:hypothetical protein